MVLFHAAGAHMTIQSKIIHRRSFMAASAAAALAPDFARAQSPVPDQLDWGRMTRADRDLAYNNGAAVPDSAQIMERIIAASTNLRAQRSKHLDVPYGEGARNK